MKPVLLYDGDCGFCKSWILRWRAWTQDEVDYEPYQTCVERFPRISKHDCEQAVHLVEANGEISKGAEAVFKTISYSPDSPQKSWPLWIYRNIPGVKSVSEFSYKLVARNR